MTKTNHWIGSLKQTDSRKWFELQILPARARCRLWRNVFPCLFYHVTWQPLVKISCNRNPCFSSSWLGELTLYYRICTLNVFSRSFWPVSWGSISECVSRCVQRRKINVIEVAECHAGSAHRMKAEEERKSAKWITMRRPWSFLILNKRYCVCSRQPPSVRVFEFVLRFESWLSGKNNFSLRITMVTIVSAKFHS